MRLVGLVLVALVLLAGGAGGQSTHMAKVTCGEFLKADKQLKSMLIMWLRGYHSGKRGGVATEQVPSSGYGGKLGRHCADNPAALLLDVSEQILAEYEK